MAEQFMITSLSAVFTLVTLVLGVVLGLLWRERHLPIVGFLLLFLFSIFTVDGLTAIILIGRSSGLLEVDGWLLGALGIIWFVAQIIQSIPALLLGLYALGIISAGWINWLFKPPPEPPQEDRIEP